MRLHPPVLEGFKQFMAAERVSGAVAKDVEEHEKSGKSDAFDSHPSLKERIAALKGLPDFKVDAQDWPAIDLLTSPGMAERELTAFLAPGGEARTWPAVSWKEAGMKVYLPIYKDMTHKHYSVFAKLTLKSVPELAGRLAEFGRNFMEPGMEKSRPELFKKLGAQGLGAALVTVLCQQGWELESLPGEKIRLLKEGKIFLPFDEIDKLSQSSTAKQDWENQLQNLGLSDLPLQVN
jgi:hypothetical protein